MLWSDLPQHKSVSSARGLLFPVFFIVRGTDSYRKESGRVRGTSLDGPNLLVCGRSYAGTRTQKRARTWSDHPSVASRCTGNGIHLSNLLRRSSNCTDIAVFVIWGGLPNWFSWYGIIAADKWATAEGTSNVFLLLSFSSLQTKNALKSMAASSILTL